MPDRTDARDADRFSVSPGCTRRQVLRAGAAVAATAVTGPVSAINAGAAGEPITPLPVRRPARVALVGVPHAAPFGTLGRAIREAALAATDFSWLAPGQRVLLKVVCNSPNAYPAVTHPVAVTVMADLLRERGATVYVGDQSGMQFVYHTREQQRGSTRACMRSDFSHRLMNSCGNWAIISGSHDNS